MEGGGLMTGESNARNHYFYGNAFASYFSSCSKLEVITIKKFQHEHSNFQLVIAPIKKRSTLSSLIRYFKA